MPMLQAELSTPWTMHLHLVNKPFQVIMHLHRRVWWVFLRL